MKSWMFAAIVLTGIVLFAPLAIAVERNVPGEYATIQAAIDASSNGDVVIIAPGTYTGTGNKNLDFAGKQITVRSTAPEDPCVAAATVIDCQNSGRGFYFHSGEGNNSIVSGLTITRGYASGYPGIGGGIYCSSSSPTIENCVISSCGAYGGPGSDLWCSPMSGCTGSLGPGGDAYGGGIYSSSDSSMTINRCTIMSNSISGGTGGTYYETGMPVGGAAGGTARGGGICAGSATIINNCMITSNTATAGNPGGDGPYSQGFCSGGGIEGGATITNCLITANQVHEGTNGVPEEPVTGGGIKTNSANISNCTITYNTATGSWTPGSGISGSGATVIVNCIIWNNSDDDLYNCSATYSCISNTDDSGTGVIHSNPLFVTGPKGNYYLRQIAAGQASDSPCINTGSDTSINLGMNLTTTRTDKMVDTGIVDMGYHYTTGYGSPDLNRDAFVDFLDCSILSLNWQQTPDPCDPNNGDIAKDSWVDFLDFAQLVSNWLTCFVTKATDPVPADHAVYVNKNVILQWSPGDYAISHDIYFGTNFNEVNNASIDSPVVYMGNQDANFWDINNFALTGLDFNTIYYWRIDEAAGCTAKGEVWRFTVGSEPNINNGIVAWWKFDEGTGTGAYDSAGANNGTVSGATWTTGHINGALSFDGTNDYVSCGSGASNYDNITVSAWIQTSTNGVLVSNRYNTGYGTWYTLSASTIELGGNSGGSGAVLLTFNTPTLDSLWHHVVYTKNGTSHAIYVDGSLDQQFTSNADISVNQTLFIGKSNMSNTWFNGKIDNVRIYNRALTAYEVMLLYSPPPPGQSSNPTPANGSTNVVITTDLSWTAGSYAMSHDVYFGTTNPPPFKVNQTSTAYDTGTMDLNTTYYWRIDERNEGTTTTGDAWSFTTSALPPGQASNPTPTNGATNVNVITDLSWTAGSNTTSHDVYFGTTNPPPFIVNQAGTNYDTGTMDLNTTYYWRIDERNTNGTTIGDIWNFKTKISFNLNNVPSEYSTIQAAINASDYGDTVVIAPGTYTGAGNRNLDFGGRAITVRSTDPNDPCIISATVINCEASGRGFYFHSGENANSILAGLTITNGYVLDHGGGISLINSHPTLTNCKIANNTASSGGGICGSGSHATIVGCIVSGNSAYTTSSGGGMYNNNYCNVTLTNCLFIDNSANGTGGGGLFNDSQSNALLTNCTFTGNSAPNGGGGAVYNKSSNCTITDSIVWGNTAGVNPEIKSVGSLSSITVSYCDVNGGFTGTGNINADPCLVSGPLGNYYLSQLAAGQSMNSPCVDAGSDTAENLDMNILTTRTDQITDSSFVDMGYHYLYRP